MPFAYAGTRRRRNRDRRRNHDAVSADAGQRGDNPQAPQSGTESGAQSGAQSSPQSGPQSGPKSNPLAERGKQEGRGNASPGEDEQDLHDPGSRDPDAPPVDNRS
ncbi:hypothetical protein [Cupriavidus sp.]|uniref:hypothetical protein n=1 Tax=Cupriavidus sp. TaxID=1873897 RepID=UPI0028BD5184|nr:hypothetical protein [Cupriavidus sp.]